MRIYKEKSIKFSVRYIDILNIFCIGTLLTAAFLVTPTPNFIQTNLLQTRQNIIEWNPKLKDNFQRSENVMTLHDDCKESGYLSVHAFLQVSEVFRKEMEDSIDRGGLIVGKTGVSSTSMAGKTICNTEK